MEHWRKTIFFIWVAQILSISGFSFALPFIPFYIQEMGITDKDSVKLWSGILMAVATFSLALASPIWGALGDRYGRKKMLLRAMGSGVVIMIGMSYAQSVEHLVILRIAQGLFTGTMAMSMIFAAATAPQERSGSTLGFIHTANFIGFFFGPMLGGFAAQMVGYRNCFMIGACLIAIAFITVLVFVREDFKKPEPEDKLEGAGTNLQSILSDRPYLLLIGVILLFSFARSLIRPLIPLHIQSVCGLSANEALNQAGILIGMLGLMTALSGIAAGKLADRRNKPGIAYLFCMLSIPWIILAGVASNYLLLFIGMSMYTFFAGGMDPVLQSIIADNTSQKSRGTAFGIVYSFRYIILGISPLVGSVIAVAASIRWVFMLSAMLLLVLSVLIIKYKTLYSAPVQPERN